MILDHKLHLPFIDSSTVNAHIRIYPDGNAFTAELRVTGVKPQRFRIGLTPQDVEELNIELQQAIENVANTCEENGRCNEKLSQLANAGKSAFNRIFADGIPRETIQRALEILSKISVATIELSSENFFIPWELLYNGPLDDQIDVSCFWGMQFIIGRTLIQDNRPGDMVSPIIEALCPQVRLVAFRELPWVNGKEIPALEELHQQKRIYLSCLRSLNPTQHFRELADFGSFLREETHIIHIACHTYTARPLSYSYLRISDRFDIAMQDFRSREFKIRDNPLVILNACCTGTMSPLHTSNWAALFWEYGARGVLATEFYVPDWFAATFIEELYKHLLSGKPIGESLWASRQHFWGEKSNPLGLAYALYSPLTIRISPPIASAT